MDAWPPSSASVGSEAAPPKGAYHGGFARSGRGCGHYSSPMLPLVLPTPERDPQSPAVLLRGCGRLVEFRASGWPLLLVIPNDCGLLDPCCSFSFASTLHTIATELRRW